MPFIVSKVVTETAAAVVIATTPVPNMYCEDTTPRFLGIQLGEESRTCYSNVIPLPSQHFSTAGRVIHEKELQYDIPVRISSQW